MAYKPAALLRRDSKTCASREYYKIIDNICFTGHLPTTASEFFGFKMEVTYTETIIGDAFRTQWKI